MTRYNSDLTVDEATLIAEYHDEVDSILDAFARASRANTTDEPTSQEVAWGDDA